jgi:hypothetical protein
MSLQFIDILVISFAPWKARDFNGNGYSPRVTMADKSKSEVIVIANLVETSSADRGSDAAVEGHKSLST